ncbi:unannotated protein [freshwater metagenome]|uniref:Protein translocase subunit SecF n=1 Tax=freshwater metagenome TaxID=449393 RepID=A0A6J6J3Y9_9ZZZZ|nr:protein translocase subunit SecF [Actinomycetota bacterium]MSZ42121.1 protein translocase subunit SecF [Actinomycetota bacterium]
MSRLGDLGQRLYDGKSSIDFVGKRKTWYVVSACILLIAIGSLLIRGLNLGIEFRGGADFSLPNATCSVEQARTVAETKTGAQAIVTVTGNGTVRVQTEPISTTESAEVADALAKTCGVPADQIKIQVVGPTWGSEISKKALQGLIVFIILVALFMSIYFEWRMAVAGLIALAHDLIITVGLYSLFGLEVTPATVIGILTILGFSLYDTVVVFDKVKENTTNITGQSVLTYSEAANLAVNQTLVRSINTTIVALLPVLAIIIVGAGLLGAGTLLDLSVALAIGMASGAYSSIFVATPFLVQLKEKQPAMVALAKRVQSRRAQMDAKTSNGLHENFDANGHAITTLVDAGVRQQPKKLPRSKRPRK